MKLISWNVNGLRACLGKGFGDFFLHAEADVMCLQETKMEKGQAELDLPFYEEVWSSAQKKGYSGTAMFIRPQIHDLRLGLGIEHHDNEGRVICADLGTFYLVNCYTPNSQRDLARLEYRMTWEDDFRAYLLALDAKKPVILCGDLNVAHREIDIKNPKSNVNSAGFTPQERAKMAKLLDSGFVDSFRHVHGDVKDRYSWWSYMGGARARNVGWRLDYFLVSRRIADKIKNADILDTVMGSDHCPVVLEIDI